MRLLLDDETTFGLGVMPVEHVGVSTLSYCRQLRPFYSNVRILQPGSCWSCCWFGFRGLDPGSAGCLRVLGLNVRGTRTDAVLWRGCCYQVGLAGGGKVLPGCEHARVNLADGWMRPGGYRSVFQTRQQNSKTTSERLPNADRRYPGST